ncbi:hypothetical protein L596_020078 [Steinernema carpocapsae]|uniref:Uncharacterized protein n=1 Tax=Steinernema carpocapsae TaxID=34508 RepID=A0A4V6XVZ7_STECR|nr:hypothetical protein L596_020078 [Steinernema carpocapsae]
MAFTVNLDKKEHRMYCTERVAFQCFGNSVLGAKRALHIFNFVFSTALGIVFFTAERVVEQDVFVNWLNLEISSSNKEASPRT